MIQLDSKKLSKDIQSVLDELQSKIDTEANFSLKVQKAQSLWNSKGGKSGKAVFKDISKNLYDMCVYVGICNYCEQNEANDIEHIYPKSFFPELTFNWENYLLACKQCNSGYKLDKCFVIDDKSDIIEVIREQEPKFKIGAFINPRFEDPNAFLILNLMSFTFDLVPDLQKVSENKAIKTIDILGLNTRDTLKHARRSAGQYYYQRMQLLLQILNANSINDIDNLLTPYDDRLDPDSSLVELKSELKESFKSHIKSYQHPSVWHSIKKIESKVNKKWENIFKELPEALDW